MPGIIVAVAERGGEGYLQFLQKGGGRKRGEKEKEKRGREKERKKGASSTGSGAQGGAARSRASSAGGAAGPRRRPGLVGLSERELERRDARRRESWGGWRERERCEEQGKGER
jgi:hypothetical protein